MASEYLKQKYKDVKPDEKIELTAEQKRRNWWDYHKYWVLLSAVALIGCAWLVKDIFFRTEPDYQVGYVSKTALPEEVLENLRARLEELGEDVNGDGRVTVELFTYVLGFDAVSMIDVDAASAGITRLTVDLSAGRVYLLLLDDPEGFQGRIGALSYLDGGPPPLDDPAYGAADWAEMVYVWDDCPVLAGMDLGTYTRFLDLSEQKINGQEAMAGLYVGRRAALNEGQKASFAADEALWLRLTEGAAGLTQEPQKRT